MMAKNREGGEKKRKRETKSVKDLPGTLEVVLKGSIEPVQTTALTVAMCDVREEWEVDFSRFFPCPPPSTAACSDLAPLHPSFRHRRARDRWISASSSASLRLARDYSSSDVVLSVWLIDTILEEHHVSELQFIWPQVSCMSGFPARGTRAMFVAYKDNLGKIQKFGLRFSSVHEAEKFMGSLKEICNEGRDTEVAEPVNTDVGPEMSAQSEFTPSSRPANQICTEKEDMATMTVAETYTPQMSPSLLNNESDQCSHTWDNIQSNYAALPPSFTSYLSNCGPVAGQVAAQTTASQEADLKSQIARYMEDDSFQDMLVQVEKVINEIGVDWPM